MWEFCLTLRQIFCIVLVFSVLDAITQQLGTAAVTQFTFAQAVQKWLRYAPDRAGGSGRRDVM
jgi:putative Mn2+ efflux pump MntP